MLLKFNKLYLSKKKVYALLIVVSKCNGFCYELELKTSHNYHGGRIKKTHSQKNWHNY